jgi:ureidoacrylate peracid hydrolase
MTIINVQGHNVNPALMVIDVQNGFVSKGGSYDQLGMDVSRYQHAIPHISELIRLCRSVNIPIFYTQAVREKSGIDLLTNTHRILPKSREERIRTKPICVISTWDADIVDEKYWNRYSSVLWNRHLDMRRGIFERCIQ